MHLYKTDLDVTSSSKLDVTFQKTSSDNVAMSLGVVLAKDIDAKTDTYTVTELPIENTTAASDGWVTATVDLSAYAGEKIAMLGLYFDGEAENYQMHIGQLKYASGKDLTPDVPTGLTIDKAYDTNEMVVSWDLGDYDTVKQYNVYAVINGVEQYMGGIYDEIYYIKNIYDAQGVVTIKVTAVGADGSGVGSRHCDLRLQQGCHRPDCRGGRWRPDRQLHPCRQQRSHGHLRLCARHRQDLYGPGRCRRDQRGCGCTRRRRGRRQGI